MLILRGILRAATTIGGGVSKKTGEIVPLRHVLQVETTDNRGLVEMNTITVPALGTFPERIGKEINLPVRAWANSGKVVYAFEEKAAASAA